MAFIRRSYGQLVADFACHPMQTIVLKKLSVSADVSAKTLLACGGTRAAIEAQESKLI